jgi:hypothetical protein
MARTAERPAREAKRSVSKTYRDRSAIKWSRTRGQEFRCRHCRMFVVALPSGGRHRNHCPFCLYSRHLDDQVPGDRASDCGGSMAPVGAFVRPRGEHVIVHRCLECGRQRHNRVAADDDFTLVLGLPAVEPRRATGERLERSA